MVLVVGIGRFGKRWVAWLNNSENGSFTGKTVGIDTWEQALGQLSVHCHQDDGRADKVSDLLLVARLDGNVRGREIIVLAVRLNHLPADINFMFSVPVSTNIEVADLVSQLSKQSVHVTVIPEAGTQRCHCEPLFCGYLQSELDLAVLRKINAYCVWHGAANIV